MSDVSKKVNSGRPRFEYKRHLRFSQAQWDIVVQMAAQDLLQPAQFLRRLILQEAQRRGLVVAEALPRK